MYVKKSLCGYSCSILNVCQQKYLRFRSLWEYTECVSVQVHVNGTVIRLAKPCPWKDHLRTVTADKNICVDFVLTKDQLSVDGGHWTIQCVSPKR